MSIRNNFSNVWQVISMVGAVIILLGRTGIAINILLSALPAAWAYFEGASWPTLAILFFVALVAFIFISLQIIKRKREKNEQEIRERYANGIQDKGKELFDFLHDGELAIEDMNKLLLSLTKEMEWIGKRMKRHTFRLNLASKTKTRYKLISSAGNDINLSAIRVKNYAEIMSYVNQAIRNNMKNFIENSAYETEKEKEALKTFIDAFANTKESAEGCIENVASYRDATKSLMGISKNLTGPCHEMYDGANLLIREVRNYLKTCGHLESTARKKLLQK